jgi:DNA-directed RNA polymerase subunit F
MDIITEDDINMVDSKKIMEERKKEKDLVYEQKICMEYLEKVVKMTPAKAKSLVEELGQIAILKPRYIALIVNMLPDTEEEVEILFSKERTNLKKEEIKQIVDIVNKHKK